MAEGKQIDTDKVMKAYTKTIGHMNEMNQKLVLVLLVYMSSDSFVSDATKMCAKMGHGNEALKEMMAQKMKGWNK